MWATGACMMIRSKDYWTAGGLDGRFFAHNEEIDLCWRLRLMGRKSIAFLRVRFIMWVVEPCRKQSDEDLSEFRNNLTMLYKI